MRVSFKLRHGTDLEEDQREKLEALVGEPIQRRKDGEGWWWILQPRDPDGQTTQEAATELREAWLDFIQALGEALYLDRLAAWLERKLKGRDR